MDTEGTNRNYDTVARALRFLADNQNEQPDLQRVAAAVDLSPWHLQRVFQQWAGVTPKQFLGYLTRSAALERLRRGETVLGSAIASGLSGPGRLHDLLLNIDAVTPGQARRKGEDLALTFGFGDSPFGRVLLAWWDRGISFLGFSSVNGEQNALAEMHQQWPAARFTRNDAEAASQANRIFQDGTGQPLEVWLRGSPFQLKVWQALVRIPEDACISYGGLAGFIGEPGAARAVGSAVGANPVSWLIPCHRVIRSVGGIGQYRWGSEIKQAILGREWAMEDRRADPVSDPRGQDIRH